MLLQRYHGDGSQPLSLSKEAATQPSRGGTSRTTATYSGVLGWGLATKSNRRLVLFSNLNRQLMT